MNQLVRLGAGYIEENSCGGHGGNWNRGLSTVRARQGGGCPVDVEVCE